MALVPSIVDQRARDEPDALYAEYPVSTLSYNEGYTRITYSRFANAINGLAWWLVKTLGPGKDFENLAYIGPNDLRYPTLILGAVKAGYTIFLTSPRNSVAAQVNLFERLHCKILLSPNPRPPQVVALTNVTRVVEVPSVLELLEKAYPPFTFEMDYAESLKRPLFAVHTSGSTGIPKPIVYTHESGARNMKMLSLVPPAGFESQDKTIQGKRVFITFPPFHGAYIVSHLFNAIPFGTVMIAPTSGAIPSAEGLIAGLRQTPADIAFLVPSIVQELSQSPELLDYCAKNLEMIIYCGGDLPQSIGDKVASKIRLLNQFGATELGLTPNILSLTSRGPNDWKYVQFHPALGFEFRHTTDDLHELYVVRDPKKEDTQPTFTIFPDLQEYGSRDLFVRHPSKDCPDLWSWRARADDIIVFLNGEKTNPVSMEQFIVAHVPNVSAALVVGAQRFQAALLIEPVTNGHELIPAERAAFIERIWPTIEEANDIAPSYARIFKSHILFTSLQKPMLRAGKGTVQRSGTLKAYSEEINALYADAERMSAPIGEESKAISDGLNENNVLQYLRKVISSITKWRKFSDDDDFFSLGMDSLHALMTVRAMRQGLALPNIALSTVYTNPSISALTKVVLHYSDEQTLSTSAKEFHRLQLRADILGEYKQKIGGISHVGKRTERVERMEFSSLVPDGESKAPMSPPKHNVVLTGSTGALGSYILDSLLCSPVVNHVYCLNRGTNAFSRQLERNKSLGLSTSLNTSQITFLTANLSEKGLGLQPEDFTKVERSATLIIHNAWPVDFNLNLVAFRPQLDGLVNLVNLAFSTEKSAQIFFISSISSIMSYGRPSGKIPERPIEAPSAPGPNGYAESKYISELLLEYARQSLGINASFARVGQIAGAAKRAGLWNKSEWFPSLVLSSLHIGAIPNSLGPTFGTVDWVPIDLLADILVDLALCEATRFGADADGSHADGRMEGTRSINRQETSLSVFHPIHPRPMAWDTVRDIVVSELSRNGPEDKSIETISLASWIQRVRKDVEIAMKSTAEEFDAVLRHNPAVKLLDFYEAGLGDEGNAGSSLEMEKTLKSSGKLRAMESIKDEWIRKWVQEWIQEP